MKEVISATLERPLSQRRDTGYKRTHGEQAAFTIADAPWFVRNTTLHRDLDVEPLQEFTQKRAKNTYEVAEDHDNSLIRAALIYDPETDDPGPAAGLRPKESIQRTIVKMNCT